MTDSPSIAIVPVIREQLARLSELAPRIWQYAYTGILSPEQISYMLEMMYAVPVLEKEFDNGVKFRFITADQVPCGFIACYEYGNEHNTIKLDKLYLDPEYHKLGIGSQVIRYVVDSAREAGYDRVILNVNKNNQRAIRAYKRNGFKVRESVKNDIGNGFFMDDYVMEKKLTK